MTISTRQGAFNNEQIGKGAFIPFATGATGATTAAAAASGSISIQLEFASQGSTLYSTLQQLQGPSGLTAPLRLQQSASLPNRSAHYAVAMLYRIGTLTLSSSGTSGWAHDAATFPVTRTVMGVANTAINLVPVFLVTTATTTTPAVFQMANASSGASSGYTNQAGSVVAGVKTMTLPAAATAVGSSYVMRLEDGDSAVQDVSNLFVTTTAAAGAGTLYGLEYLAPLGNSNIVFPSYKNSMFNGIALPDMNPAVATSGTATSLLCVADFTGFTTTISPGFMRAFYDS